MNVFRVQLQSSFIRFIELETWMWRFITWKSKTQKLTQGLDNSFITRINTPFKISCVIKLLYKDVTSFSYCVDFTLTQILSFYLFLFLASKFKSHLSEIFHCFCQILQELWCNQCILIFESKEIFLLFYFCILLCLIGSTSPWSLWWINVHFTFSKKRFNVFHSWKYKITNGNTITKEWTYKLKGICCMLIR